ncbi:MAG: hypothetical protein HOY71_25815 [Nonomuraea sp.]|nr:hypothetical protein [Nonomuraea sp.]
MTKLERRYRLLLRAYPPGYREEYGEEYLDVLLERAQEGSSIPHPREAYALVLGGLRTRLIEAAQGPAWVDGLHLGVTVLALTNFALLIPYAQTIPIWLVLSGLVFFAVLLGSVRLALPAALLTGSKLVAIAMGVPWLDQTLLPVLPDVPWQHGPALYGSGGPVAPATTQILVVLGLIALSARGEPPRRRSWLWVALVPVLAGADPAWLDLASGAPTATVRVVVEAAILCLAAYAGHLTRDPRWAVAAVVYFLPATAVLGENLTAASRYQITHWALIAVLTLAAAAVPFSARRRVLL